MLSPPRTERTGFGRRWCVVVLSLLSLSLMAGCRQNGSVQRREPVSEEAMRLRVTSVAFEHGAKIPTRYTADGPDQSPPLRWDDPPQGTKSFALICDDPDAPRGTWVHWVIWNIPATARGLPEGVPPDPELPDGSRQGTNDFGRIGYGGPAPPPGKPHRYYFRLYALDTVLTLRPGARRDELEDAMQGHVLAQGELMGTYGR